MCKLIPTQPRRKYPGKPELFLDIGNKKVIGVVHVDG